MNILLIRKHEFNIRDRRHIFREAKQPRITFKSIKIIKSCYNGFTVMYVILTYFNTSW